MGRTNPGHAQDIPRTRGGHDCVARFLRDSAELFRAKSERFTGEKRAFCVRKTGVLRNMQSNISIILHQIPLFECLKFIF